jgi:hypothetical protein
MLHAFLASDDAGALPLVQKTVAADSASVNLFTLCDSPASAIEAVVTIASGVHVYSLDNQVPALTTGSGWPVGSKLTLVNNGEVMAQGGAKGNGGTSAHHNGYNGEAGGHALEISDANLALIIDNTFGYIYAGGGGGGGGGYCYFGILNLNGGDGGHGAGWQGAQTSGEPGDSGGGGNHAGDGGNGRAYGFDGADGTEANCGTNKGIPGSGGVGGKAVKLNGHAAPTWLGGNNPTQVRGDVA